MRHRRLRIVAAGAVCLSSAVGATGVDAVGGAGQQPLPPDGGPGQSVDARFTAVAAPGPCIVVGGPTSIDFGVVGFGAGFATGSSSTSVGSCQPGPPSQDVRASVSDATTSTGVPVWTPIDCGAANPIACVPPVNGFGYLLGGVSLTSADRSIGPPSGATMQHQLRLPAPGSDGGGEIVSVTVTILAVLQ